MKKLLVFFIIALFFVSCSKDEIKPGTGKCMFGKEETNFKTSCIAVITSDKLVVTLSNLLPLRNLIITISDYKGTGTYTVESNYASFDYEDGFKIYGAEKGKVEITSADDQIIEGKFSFTAKNNSDSNDVVEVTDGLFSAKIQSK